MDDLLLELVVGEGIFALFERERARRNEGEQAAGAPADGAVALGYRLGEVDVDAIADGAAVTAAMMGVGHGFLLAGFGTAYQGEPASSDATDEAAGGRARRGSRSCDLTPFDGDSSVV
jgi:hypothetical protein